MSEVYPSDNALLNIQSDSDTGVEFIPTGQSPYYLHFRKLLHRLILATKKANELRVFDEGGLEIGVKQGSFWFRDELIEYSGSSGNELADNKENIYIYLDSQANLVIDEYDDFPDMATNAHVRLAVISTSAGDIESITDHRGGYNFVVPHASEGQRKSIEVCSGGTLESAQSGSVITNEGASAAVTVSLPADCPEGVIFHFVVLANQEFRIDPGNQAIKDSCGQIAGKYKYASTIGNTLALVCDTAGDWITISKYGTWTEES